MFLGGCCLHRSFFFATMNYAFWTYDDDLESLAGPLTFYIHLPRPGLVKLLVLSNFPAFVHCDPCFTGLYGQCCLSFCDILSSVLLPP